jgi:hypothetical protein
MVGTLICVYEHLSYFESSVGLAFFGDGEDRLLHSEMLFGFWVLARNWGFVSCFSDTVDWILKQN